MAGELHKIFREAVELPDDRIDLGRAALAIAQAEYPGLQAEAYVARLDRLAAIVHDRAAGENNPYRLIASLNHVLFTQEGYRGNRDDYYDPRNSFLNEVIERRVGIPITLSVFYMEIARRAGLELHGVGFPGHFLVKYAGEEGEIVIDPFDKGEVRTTEELQELLDRLYGGKVALQPEFLARISNKQIIQRMLANLKANYVRQENFVKAVSVVERLVILDPISADEIRDRGLLYLKLERSSEAIDDLETYLRLMPDAADAEEILEQLLELKKRPAQVH